MATYPMAKTTGSLDLLITHLRTRKFPAKLEAKTLQNLSIAPKNESYVLNTLKFISIIDKDGAGVPTAKEFFVLPDDQFQLRFAELVQKAYDALFALHGDSAWTLNMDKLIAFFRQEDQSTAITGKYQAVTFSKLSEIAGKRGTTAATGKKAVAPKERNGKSKEGAASKTSKLTSNLEGEGKPSTASQESHSNGSELTLAIKIEMVLPTTDKKEVYDALFQSIKENFGSAW